MNIILEKQANGISLKELSFGDLLGFSDGRVEKVRDVKPEFGELYTQRIFINGNTERFEVIKKVYELNIYSGIITANSKGRTYDSKTIKNITQL